MPAIPVSILLLALVSWGIAFFEYLLQVPANRIVYMRQPLKLDCLWAALCMPGSAYFIFREGAGA